MDDITFDSSLRERLERHLDAHEVLAHPAGGRSRAAVGLILIDSDAEYHGMDEHGGPLDPEVRQRLIDGTPGLEDTDDFTGSIAGTAGGAAFIITRRESRLSKHPGQWALPGGRLDDGETAMEAALREIEEEIGLTLGPDDLVGQLDDFPTRSGFVITPFVFWAGDSVDPVPNPVEVESIHRVRIRELLRPDSPRFVAIPESDRPVIQVPLGGDLIHAPTGAVLYQFRVVAYEGRPARVDHYEQPLFAWK